MFHRVRATLAVATIALASTSCVYQNVVLPLDTDLQVTKVGSKRGESSASTILGLIQVGDAGVHAAAQDGGISVMQHADQQRFNILGVYQECTTIVYGE